MRGEVQMFGAAIMLVATTAAAGDLVTHNGFEACWSQAISEQDFLDLEKSAIDNVTSCVPPQDFGTGITACTTAACPNATVGCPVKTHAGAFNGAFAAGSGNHFTSTGSADDMTIDVHYTGGSCAITISNIALDYALDYSFQNDGNNGLWSGSLDLSTLGVHPGYNLDGGTDFVCQSLVALYGSSLISQIETAGAAAIATLEQPVTVGETVCPAPAG